MCHAPSPRIGSLTKQCARRPVSYRASRNSSDAVRITLASATKLGGDKCAPERRRETAHGHPDLGTRRAALSPLFDLTGALLCADGPVTTGGSDSRSRASTGARALNGGNFTISRLQRLSAALLPMRSADGPARPGHGCQQLVSFRRTHLRGPPVLPRLWTERPLLGSARAGLAVLLRRRASWCQFVDAQRLGPGHDAAEVTAAQLRQVVRCNSRSWKRHR